MSHLPAAALLVVAMTVTAPAQEPPKKQAEDTTEFQKEVTTFRGLKFTKAVTVGEYTREELLVFIRKEMERELPKDEAEKMRKALVHFGLISPALDLYKTVIDLLGASIAGFYHPK